MAKWAGGIGLLIIASVWAYLCVKTDTFVDIPASVLSAGAFFSTLAGGEGISSVAGKLAERIK